MRTRSGATVARGADGTPASAAEETPPPSGTSRQPRLRVENLDCNKNKKKQKKKQKTVAVTLRSGGAWSTKVRTPGILRVEWRRTRGTTGGPPAAAARTRRWKPPIGGSIPGRSPVRQQERRNWVKRNPVTPARNTTARYVEGDDGCVAAVGAARRQRRRGGRGGGRGRLVAAVAAAVVGGRVGAHLQRHLVRLLIFGFLRPGGGRV